jgi:hypothetical protein
MGEFLPESCQVLATLGSFPFAESEDEALKAARVNIQANKALSFDLVPQLASSGYRPSKVPPFG